MYKEPAQRCIRQQNGQEGLADQLYSARWDGHSCC